MCGMTRQSFKHHFWRLGLGIVRLPGLSWGFRLAIKNIPARHPLTSKEVAHIASQLLARFRFPEGPGGAPGF